MRGLKWVAAVAVVALVASATAEARTVGVSGPVPVFGVNQLGQVDPGLVGLGTGKLMLSTRSGYVRGKVRGFAPNLSGRRFRFKTRSLDLVGPLIGQFLQIPVPMANSDFKFKKASYNVSRRGRVNGSVRARLRGQLLQAVRDLLNGSNGPVILA